MRRLLLTLGLCGPLLLVACATESSRSLAVAKVEAAAAPYQGPRLTVTLGKFDNRSAFMRGAFTDGNDRLGAQARGTLMAHLQQTQRFIVMDRDNLDQGREEASRLARPQQIAGAQYLVVGDISEFGRKDVGDMQLFGLLGRGKTQVAYAKVTLNVVNALTSAVVYSGRGAGEVELSNREIVGFGGTAGYDATLNGKVLDLAIREAVNQLVAGLDAGLWVAPASDRP